MVRQIKVLAVALAFIDRIATLTEWTVREIRATPELRAQVQTILGQAFLFFDGNVQRSGGNWPLKG
jgi:hypothetical protein